MKTKSEEGVNENCFICGSHSGVGVRVAD